MRAKLLAAAAVLLLSAGATSAQDKNFELRLSH